MLVSLLGLLESRQAKIDNYGNVPDELLHKMALPPLPVMPSGPVEERDSAGGEVGGAWWGNLDQYQAGNTHPVPVHQEASALGDVPVRPSARAKMRRAWRTSEKFADGILDRPISQKLS